VGLELRTLGTTASSAQVQAVVTNEGVGHAVPGGLGNRQLVLVVGVDAGGGALAHAQRRVYQRQLRDAEGRTLTSISELFLSAAAVAEDSRIRPMHSRTESFTLPLPEGWRSIVARLELRDTALPEAEPVLIREERLGR
jgi:hypothetical protein